MSEHISIERMNECVDGFLTSSERQELERHTESCEACRNQYARLSETVRAVASLPRAASAPGGLWAVIEGRIEQGPAEADEDVSVFRLPTSAPEQKRWSFTIPQAIAAGLAVSVASAGLMWAALGGGARPPAGAEIVEPVGGAAARAVSLSHSGYEDAVTRLEAILEEGRAVLTPETLVSIEESLATIDDAIAEIETALTEDPNSDLLRRMLAARQQSRLGVLERAAAAVAAQT